MPLATVRLCSSHCPCLQCEYCQGCDARLQVPRECTDCPGSGCYLTSSSAVCLQDGLCVRTVIGCSPGGFPGPATSPGLALTAPLAASRGPRPQSRAVAGSIFFIPSPRTKFGDLGSITAASTRDTLPDGAVPSVMQGPPSSQASSTASCMGAVPSRRRLEFFNLGSASTEGGSFMRVDSSHCPFAALGSLGVQDDRRDAGPGAALDTRGAQVDVFRQPASTVMVRLRRGDPRAGMHVHS